MKKLFKSMFVLAALSTTMFVTSCGDKVDDIPKEFAAPTLTVNDGVKASSASLGLDTVMIKVVASADTDVKLTKISITRAIVGQSTAIVAEENLTAKDLIKTYVDALDVVIDEGDVITYTVKVEDGKGKSTLTSFTVTINSMVTSGQILIGAPSNTTNEYRFFGIADGFRRYRAGATGADLAKDNSSKIDFIYFYNSAGNVLNALYSPDYNFTAGTGWATEVASWPTKNRTEYKLTGINASEFDALVGGTFMTELQTIDFEVGMLDRIAVLSVNQVYAFKKSDGKRGLIKIGSPAAGATGQILLIVKVEL
ncbi:MAG: hypothetical protein Q8R57_13325 [Bacteroidota bacterium]|nr:hypothetical protein [Bacteroidota bacterium]